MLGAVAVHVADGLVDAADHAHGQVGRKVLGLPVGFPAGTVGVPPAAATAAALVGVRRHAARGQLGERRGQEALGGGLVHEQRLGGVAHAEAAAFAFTMMARALS